VIPTAEVGIDIAQAEPLRWSGSDIRSTDVIVTMGCGDTLPFCTHPDVDWGIEDPAGRPVAETRAIRDGIAMRGIDSIDELTA
jgi:arsenate reductase